MILGKVRLGSRKDSQLLILPLFSDEKDVTRWGAMGDKQAKEVSEAQGSLKLAEGARLIPSGAEGGSSILRLELTADPECHSSEWFRRAGAVAYRTLASLEAREAFLEWPQGGREFDLEGFTEGFLLASYRFAEYRKVDPKSCSVSLTLAKRTAKDAKTLTATEALVQEIARARDLVNRPAEDLNPLDLESEARKLATRKGLTCKVIKGKALEKGFPAIFAVGKGSKTGPCLIEMDWNPGKTAKAHYVLCGKGITYDSGGYHVKPLTSMVLMKKDMSGAAIVLSAVHAAARLGLPIRVTALLATAENMISANSFRPGDILKSRSGKTIEIRSTDAEGRLVLADALALASEMKPDGIIDVATLTGVAARFVGNSLAPVMGNDEALGASLKASGDRTHERLLTIPLLREFREATIGKISDLRNWGEVGGHPAGTMVAGGFLSHFVAEVPWAHIDMSNCSWENSDSGYLAAGGTAFGVRMLVDFLTQKASES